MTTIAMSTPAAGAGPVKPDLSALTAALTPLLPGLQALEGRLNTLFIERSAAVRAILVALLTRQHAVLLGPPGAAKSDLISTLARLIGGERTALARGARARLGDPGLGRRFGGDPGVSGLRLAYAHARRGRSFGAEPPRSR